MSDSRETEYLRRRVGESHAARGLAEGGGARHSHAILRAAYQKRLDASTASDNQGEPDAGGDLAVLKEEPSRSQARWEDEGGQGSAR